MAIILRQAIWNVSARFDQPSADNPQIHFAITAPRDFGFVGICYRGTMLVEMNQQLRGCAKKKM